MLTLVPRDEIEYVDDTIEVDVFITGDTFLRGYQVGLRATDGDSERLDVADIYVDETRIDYLFQQLEAFIAIDVERRRLASALLEGDLPIDGGRSHPPWWRTSMIACSEVPDMRGR